MLAMRRKRSGAWALVGFTTGLALGLLIFGRRRSSCLMSSPLVGSPSMKVDPINLIHLPKQEQQRQLLFVGVMTAAKYVPSRAVAVWNTWGRRVPGRIAFFSSEGSNGPPELPLVPLVGVDDSYPPQRKSLAMLAFMAKHYLDRFDWFMRADDDVMVRPDKLEALLRSIDSRRAWFLGQAGRGSAAEAGTLALAEDENFCMGGPGVILSRETLARVAPHLRSCLENLVTSHEDVELGRCVRKFAGVSCTWSYEMQTILYHNGSGDAAYTGSLKTKEVHRAITLHPVKDYNNMYRLHRYMNKLRVREMQSEAVLLHRDLLAMSDLLNMSAVDRAHSASPYNADYLGDTSLIGLPPGLTKFQPKNINELISWDFIQRSVYSVSDSNPRRRIEAPLREGLDDIVTQAMDKINMYSKQRGRIIDFKEVLYGYSRYNPLYGTDYILDMLLIYRKYRGKKMTIPVRRHTYFQQQFTGLEIHEIHEGVEIACEQQEEDLDFSDTPNSVDTDAGLGTVPEGQGTGLKETLEHGLMKIKENLPLLLSSHDNLRYHDSAINEKVINFIVPLSGRLAVFKRFISVYEKVCLNYGDKTTLKIVLFPDDNGSIEKILAVLAELRQRHPSSVIKVVPVFESFSRGKALSVGSMGAAPSDLLLFIDVDMVFDASSLRRIRSHTILGKQAYFPIVYSEYDPRVTQNISESPNHFKINDYTGFWRQYGFGIASMYKDDLMRVGGFNTTIKGWGKEDVDLFDKFISKHSEVKVFRSTEPGMVHVWHNVACMESLGLIGQQLPDREAMCRATRADTIAGRTQLAKYYLNNRSSLS